MQKVQKADRAEGKMKTCLLCNRSDVEFGMHKGMPGGFNRRCKSCLAKQMRVARLQRKERQAKQRPIQERTKSEVVREAIAKGCRTRQEIKRATRLSMDEVCDILAELYDKENLVLRAA